VFGRMNKALAVVALVVLGVIAGGASALASGDSSRASAAGFQSKVFASGAKIFHTTPKGKEAISLPDDLTSFQGHIFVGYQNGVGPQGEPSTTGNLDSTIVEFSMSGHAVRQWDVVGKCDGLTADPVTGRLIATVNEDAKSSVYLIDPVAGGAAVHYQYNKPLPHKGGTDAISIYGGQVIVSASAPGTTGAAAPSGAYPAAYVVVFDSATHVAKVHPLFSDEAPATVANTGATQGKHVRLALTDPDSSEDVPTYSHRFAGDFMLTSQGDLEQIFVSHLGTRHQALSVLKLPVSVDDTAWAADSSGAIYTTDTSVDGIDKITGPFKRGSVFESVTPCNANSAPSTCPAPGFSANYVGALDLFTGAISHVSLHGSAVVPHGMIFVP
jgi:hypothetical protein